MAGLIVQKYGGTSVGTPERIQAVADRIAECRARGHSLVVVVSAMGHTTDELISLAHQISQSPPHREMDMLLSAGERISMALLSMALAERSIPALSFTGSQSGIITTSAHRRARIQRILGDRVRQALASGHVAIVAGFQGVSENREITTLGRGGSDTSAVALAAALLAERCEIYTDVDGVFSADPRVVSKAKLLREISHDHVVELATRGAGVLHPRSIELARRFRVPLQVLNSVSIDCAGTGSGTRIVVDDSAMTASGSSKMEDFRVVGVTSDSSKVWLKVRLTRPTVLAALWSESARLALQAVAVQFDFGELRAFVDQDAAEEWRKLLSNLASQGFVEAFGLHEEWVPVSVVGDRFTQDGSALQRVVEVLAGVGVDVASGSCSALAMTVAVPRSREADAVAALHEALVEEPGRKGTR